VSKVLLVSRSLTPPWDEASKNFARVLALRAEGSEMTVLTSGVTNEFPERVTQLPIYSRPVLDWAQRLRLLRLRSLRNRFDVVHYLFTPTRLNSTLFRRIMGGGSARSLQTIASLNGRDYTSEEIRQLIFSDQVVTYSEFSRRKLERLGIANAETIQPGIDLSRFSKSKPSAKLAGQLRVSTGDYLALYPGEYTRLGATDTLVEVLPELVRRVPNLVLVFGCRIKNPADAEKKRQVAAAIEAAGLRSHAVFTDTISDMPALYNLADVVLFPVETMVGKFDVPLSVIEAMACEKAVVVSDLEVLAEFVTDDTAVTIRAGDRRALVDSVARLAANPQLAAKLGANARRYVEKWFDIDKIAARYEAVYERLAGA
jgi:glycosyltransferase involved in cell wall biosynthesis